MREDYIHFFARRFLRERDWLLVAGQYPDGSDDELPSLNVMDPELARDRSPDHRRHSMNKLVPDLVAYREGYLLVIEAKPRHDTGDEEKLLNMLGQRRADFLNALDTLIRGRGIGIPTSISELTLVPCLSFSAPKRFRMRQEFAYLIIREELKKLIGNGLLPSEFEDAT